jgi:flagellar hook-basal body complex protein FliE
MAINFTDAVKAYEKVARQDAIPGPGAPQVKGGADFSDVLREATEGAMGALHEGERQSLKAAAGTADLNDVVMAVGKAEMTLQTVVAVRDRVIQAYQEIIRMPI